MQNFKTKWNPDETNPWTEFSPEQLNKTSLSDLTKVFLLNGFPERSAPFLSFGLEHNDPNFKTLAEYSSQFQLEPNTKNYWVFGSDGSGNPIIIDSNSNDEILLLDHEQGFVPIQKINRNVVELLQCLLEYKNFIELINSQFGEGGFFDSKFTLTHLDELKKRFEQINSKIFSESDFWNCEIELLYEEIQ
jgi:hypothetical protein